MERYTEEKLNKMSVHTLRVILRSEFGGVPGVCNKSELINKILVDVYTIKAYKNFITPKLQRIMDETKNNEEANALAQKLFITKDEKINN